MIDLMVTYDLTVQYFAKFNQQGPSIMEYSQYEYDQHLADPDWSSSETTYMFNLLREYDVRFVIAADRYEYRDPRGGPIKRRSVEVREMMPALKSKLT